MGRGVGPQWPLHVNIEALEGPRASKKKAFYSFRVFKSLSDFCLESLQGQLKCQSKREAKVHFE